MKLLLKKNKYFCNHIILQYFKTVILLQLKVTWNNLTHFYIRLTKLILKRHNCLTQQVSRFRCEIAPPSTQAELSLCLSPVITVSFALSPGGSEPPYIILPGSHLEIQTPSGASYAVRVRVGTKDKNFMLA